MSDIYGLLNINADIIKDFYLLAARVADHQTEKVVNKNMSKLKQIEDQQYVDKGLEVNRQSVDEVMDKVIRMASSGDTSGENWTTRELRIVSYYLMKLRDDRKNYMYALELLDHNWTNLFFNGLAFYVLNSWHSIEPDYRTATCQLLVRKLSEYDGSNRKYNLWKNRLNLFDENGPTRMAAMLSAKHMNIGEAPTLLGFKETSIKQSYYSDVIIKYVANNRITDRNVIEGIFELHNLDRTKKLVFAYLVEEENQRGDDIRRAQLCRFANSQLGDVTLPTSWAPFTGATEADVQKLKKAMQLVNMWFAQQVIESFFEICVQDKERKKFWLQYVSSIDAFKIVGSTVTKRLLQSNSKIGSMVLSLYIETNSYSSRTSAMVLFIKNKMLVEFSDKGALYVYNHTHSMVKKVTNARLGIASTNDLKIPSMDGIVEKNSWGDYSIFNDEGKLNHIGNWQSRLTAWMNNKLFSSKSVNVSFRDDEYNDIFRPKPLPAENYQSQLTGNESNKSEFAPAIDNKQLNVTNVSCINETQFSYKIASKKLENNVQVVANAKGFYLSLGKNHYQLIKPFEAGESPTGSIWIKKAHLTGWSEIVHNYRGTDTRSIGFIRINTEVVVFKESLSVAGKTKFKLY